MATIHTSHRPNHILDTASRLMTAQAVLPHSRGVHIFYPNLAAVPLMHNSSAFIDATSLVLDTNSTSQTVSTFQDSKNSYVPLWHASSSVDISTLALHGLDTSPIHHLDGLTLTSNQDNVTALIPVDLVATSSRGNGMFQPFVASSGPWNPPLNSDSSVRSASEVRNDSSSFSNSPSPSFHSSHSSQSSAGDAFSSIPMRPLASSTTAHDTSSASSSGSNTPTRSSAQTPEPIPNAFFGPSSVTKTGAVAQSASSDHLQVSSASSDADRSDQPGVPPLWAQSFSTPRHRKLNYAFEHGAYGIPKRHPWAAVRGNGKRQPAPTKPAARSGAVGMLAAAADFLTGTTSPSGPAHKNDKLGGEVLTAEDGSRLGLNSPIREHGRIVQDRLESVQVGEDAYFLRPDSLGVADGVGGWASRAGADPALFSRLLMHFCAAELGKFDNLSTDQLAADGGLLLKEWEQVDPVEVMHTAWERCVRASRREGILGSSTALIAVLRGDELKISNLGDCVLLIIRAGSLLFRSTEQQHSFNFPVQLGMMGYTAESVTLAASRTLARDGFLQSGASNDLDDDAPNPLGTSDPANNKPRVATGALDDEDDEAEWDEPRRDAGRWTIKVQKGDIIIVGSDGLVDNLFDEDIVEEVLKFAAPPPVSHVANDATDEPEYSLPDGFSPQLVSEALCSRAKAVSEDSRAVSSPFQQRAMEEGLHYVGGKHDDISVVVAVVGNPAEPLTRSSHAFDSNETPAANAG